MGDRRAPSGKPLQTADRAIVVIPARYGSTRFAGKPLAVIRGVPMIVHVFQRASKIRNADTVIVATDDPRIKAIVDDAGGTAIMTSSEHQTGTSRVREAAAKFTHGIVVNVQGDEPLLPSGAVERLIDAMREDRSLMMGTLAAPLEDLDELARPDVVKVVCDRDGNALYFSRSPIPYPGIAPGDAASSPDAPAALAKGLLRHVGVYAFRRELLMMWRRLPLGPLERLESLEQLRALENGYRIRVVTCRTDSIGVDRPEDLKKVERALRSRPGARRARSSAASKKFSREKR
jgi:3-deoxy-manno-octulosonate cytidylyltransferase (CMP-KDO synthetase)